MYHKIKKVRTFSIKIMFFQDILFICNNFCISLNQNFPKGADFVSINLS